MAIPYHYDEDPELYISRKFRMYERYWVDVLESESTDNWQMYNGWDEYIRRRKQEQRSALQLPLLYPAIEGRTAQIIAKLTQREPIIQLRPLDKKDPMAIMSALKIQHWIRSVLDRQQWLEELALTIMAAEVFPLVWVKCRIGEIEMTPAEQRLLESTFGLPPGALANERRYVPEFEVLPPGNVFFDYRAKNRRSFIEKFHVKDMTPDEVHERFGADVMRRVERFESTEEQWIKDWEEAAGRKNYRESGEPRYRLAEGWIWAHKSTGEVERRVVRFFPDVIREEFGEHPVGYLVEDDAPPTSFDPFEPVVARRLPFQLMGKSTVALGKAFQRERSELTNMAIDILGYSAAPPIVMQKGSVDNPNQLSFESRALWMINDDVGMVPQALHVPTPNAPFLQAMMVDVENNMNHITAAYEGITGQPNLQKGAETLGEFRARTSVGHGRLDLPMMSYATVIQKIAEKYWYYMREYPRSIIGRTPLPVQTPVGRAPITVEDLDVPADVVVNNITSFENDEIKKIELDRAIERSLAYPIVQLNPALMQFFMTLYWKRHISDPDDMEEFMVALNQPLDPSIAAMGGGGGGGVNNLGIPQTQFSPGVGNIERNRGLVNSVTSGGG